MVNLLENAQDELCGLDALEAAEVAWPISHLDQRYTCPAGSAGHILLDSTMVRPRTSCMGEMDFGERRRRHEDAALGLFG